MIRKVSALPVLARSQVTDIYVLGRRGPVQAKFTTQELKELGERIQSPTQVCGELVEEERRLLARKRKTVLLASPAQSLRRPAYLAELAWHRWQSGQIDNPVSLSPFYLHTGDLIPGG